jgi:hypothetical protein
LILRETLPPSDTSEDLRDAWKLWCRRYGIDPGEVVGEQVIEVDTEANTIKYIGYDLCEKGHRNVDWDGGGTKASQSVRVVQLSLTPDPPPGRDWTLTETACRCVTGQQLA